MMITCGKSKRFTASTRCRLACCFVALLSTHVLLVQLFLDESSFVLFHDKTLQSDLAEVTGRGRQLDHFQTEDFDVQVTHQHIDQAVVVTSDPFAAEDNRKHPNYAVFYNIYVNSEQEDISTSGNIVFEQLQQIGRSDAAATGELTIYYNTVGHSFLLDTFFSNRVQEWCNGLNLQCIHMEHHPSGFEEITLQKAYEFCNRFPDRSIIYLHNKGSHNSGRWNIPWRRHMTRAITTDTCLGKMDQCTTCGLLFQPIWTFFYPGNFFVSRCDYVNRLIPPNEFEKRNEKMLEQRPNDFVGLIFDEWESTLGRQRYSMEHWIGTHPSFVPCHLSTDSSIRTWTGDDGLPFSFMTASQLPLGSVWFQGKQGRMEKIMSDEGSRKREWFLLGGFLYKWYTLYQHYPPESSWVWDYFPDGREWQELVHRHSNISLALLEAWQKSPPSGQWLEMVGKEMDRREKNRLAAREKEIRIKRRRERLSGGATSLGV